MDKQKIINKKNIFERISTCWREKKNIFKKLETDQHTVSLSVHAIQRATKQYITIR